MILFNLHHILYTRMRIYQENIKMKSIYIYIFLLNDMDTQSYWNSSIWNKESQPINCSSTWNFTMPFIFQFISIRAEELNKYLDFWSQLSSRAKPLRVWAGKEDFRAILATQKAIWVKQWYLGSPFVIRDRQNHTNEMTICYTSCAIML